MDIQGMNILGYDYILFWIPCLYLNINQMMNFRQQLAKFVTGNITTDQLPMVGMKGLEQGLDSSSLRILAGLGKDENPFVIEHYFNLALEELKIEFPDRRQAAIEYSDAIIEEIFRGGKDIITGINEIINSIGSYDFLSESLNYCYDSIGFEKLYGLFDTYNELLVADKPWQPNKTNNELIEDVKIQLEIELRKWKKRIIRMRKEE